MKTYLLSSLQILINGYIRLDPYASNLRQPLLNKTIAIKARELPFPLYFNFIHDKIILLSHHENPNATIQGSLLNMARFTRRENKTAAMSELQIQIIGDTDSAYQFQQFWDSIYIDWAEVIAKLAGDPVAVILGRSKKIINHALQQAKITINNNLSEYIQEELKILPPREEIIDFMNDVDLLRADIDRLVVRIQRLESHNE